MYNINDIARISGYSKSTISAAINNKPGVGKEAREKILNIIERLNYTPNEFAINVSKGDYKTIAVVVRDITNSFYARLYRAVESVFETLGYTTLVINTNNNHERLLDSVKSLIGKRVDGIILDISTLDEKALQVIKENEINCVIFGLGSDEFDSIEADDCKASYEMTKYLIEKKRRSDILFVCQNIDENEYSKRRYRGIKRYENESNTKFCEIMDYHQSSSFELGKEIGEKILARYQQLPSAIIAYNDLIAAGIIKTFLKHDVDVKEDVIVTGFDNNESILFSLNTVEIPVYDMGVKAAELLLDRIKNRDKKISNIMFDAKLITH